MTLKNNGGPAFPAPSTYSAHGDYEPREYGMNLRDWFAGQALAGILSGPMRITDENKRRMVEDAWAIADGMLETRDA